MMDVDARLFNRLRDLQQTLGQDVDWLTRHFRPDALRDLGERLSDLGGDLTTRAADLNSVTLAKLPASRWIPEAGTPPGAPRLAHYVGEEPLRCGLVFLARCGAACFPFYGNDRTGRIHRHRRCPTCQRWTENEGKPQG